MGRASSASMTMVVFSFGPPRSSEPYRANVLPKASSKPDRGDGEWDGENNPQ